MSDRVLWTDGQYSGVLYSDTSERDHRSRLAVGLFPLTTVVAIDDSDSPLYTGDTTTAYYCVFDAFEYADRRNYLSV